MPDKDDDLIITPDERKYLQELLADGDIFAKLAEDDELFLKVLYFVDGLEKTYNTVDVARAQQGRVGDITVVGNVIAVNEAVPVPFIRDDKKGVNATLKEKVVVYFELAGESLSILCGVHNVLGLEEYGYWHGQSDENHERILANLLFANKYGKKVSVTGRFVNVTADRKSRRVLYVDTFNLTDSTCVQMKNSQFDRFVKLCQKHKWTQVMRSYELDENKKPVIGPDGRPKTVTSYIKHDSITPLQLFGKEVFVGFEADEYLMKTIALFCLSPRSRQEQFNILMLTAPGEGKDYLIDKIIRPTVKCGKVSTETTAPALVGAMSSDNLNSLGIGVLQRYHNEHLACSEVQSWDVKKIRALLSVLAEGKVYIAKGKIGDADRNACENILLAGNISNTWKEGMPKKEMMSAFMSGKNKQYVKQYLSRMAICIIKPTLLDRQDDESLAKKMFKNFDTDSATHENELFETDEEIKRYCLDKFEERARARRIRKRKTEILLGNGMHDRDVREMLRHLTYQEFFGHYFKYVSSQTISVSDAGDGIYRAIKHLASRADFAEVMCNVAGDIDKRKAFQQFPGICLAFAKVQGHLTGITADDIGDAENLLKTSLETMIDGFGKDFLVCGLEQIELDMLKYIHDGGERGVTEADLRRFAKADAGDEFFDKNLENVKNYVIYIEREHKYTIDYDEILKIPEGLLKEMNIVRPAKTKEIVPAKKEARITKITDEVINNKLGAIFDKGGA